MLTRKNRFHGHGSVRRAYRMGRAHRTSLFSLHTLSGEKVRTSRAAVVVSRKVHKSAVKRNRIRRRIYEYIRLRMPDLKQPTEMVFTVYQADVADLPPEQLSAALDELFKKARL